MYGWLRRNENPMLLGKLKKVEKWIDSDNAVDFINRKSIIAYNYDTPNLKGRPCTPAMADTLQSG